MTELASLRTRIAELDAAASRHQELAAALGASEIRYRRLFEAARDGILILDADTGEIVAVNPFLTNLLGYSQQELIGLKLWEIGFFRDKKESKAAFQELQQHEYIRYDDLPLQTKGGRSVAVEFVSNVYVAGEKKVIQCNIRDITDRKRAEDELRGVSTHLAIVLENITDGFFVLDRELRFIDVNRPGARMLGREPEQLTGRLLLDEFPQAADTPFVRAYRRSLETGEAGVVEDYFAPLDQWFEARVYPWPSGVSVFFSNVSTRRRAEEELRESKAQLQLISENVLDLVAELSADAVFVYASSSYARVLGYPPQELIGTSGFALLHPDDLERVQGALAETLRGGEGRSEFRYRHADGHYLWLDALGRAFVDAAGETGIVLTARDITGRKHSEEQQRQSQERFRTIFEEAPLGMAVMDSVTGRIAEVNRRFAQIAGRTRDELVGVDWMSITHPDDVEEDLSNMALMNAGEISGFNMTKRYRRPDGSEAWVNMTIAPFADEGTRRSQHVCMIEDITEHKAADELRRLQSAALDAADDGIVITDRAGAIEWVNPAFTRLTGYGAPEALGRNPRDLIKSGKHTRLFFQDFWDTILAGGTWHGEVINRRKDGRLYTELQSVTPILNASGTITHFVAIKQDITERLLLEAQYRQAQKMESVGQLASGIAHDFNNLLTVINGMSELVLAQVDHDDPVHVDVQEILRAGERAATLTRQLLAFSRRQILEPQVLNVNTVVEGMESLLRRLLGEDVDLAVVLAPALGRVKADRGQLEQVVSNLAVNARDAMPLGGRLTIETQNVEIAADYARQHSVPVPAGSYVRLVVSDSGVGMDEDTRARIFEPFFTTKAPGHGTGLGLSTVYGIVKQSQGFVLVYSEVGHGTGFTVLLPRVAEAAGTVRPAATQGASSGTETILLVEDDAALRKLAARVLEPAGYTVIGAADGEDALRLLELHGEPIHLLLTDVVMPGMSGRQLSERLAQGRTGMKTLFMSGYTDDTIVRHGVLDAQVAFLHKPFTAAALLRKVREVLDAGA